MLHILADAAVMADPFAKIPANFDPTDDADKVSVFFIVMASVIIVLSIIAVAWVFWKVRSEHHRF